MIRECANALGVDVHRHSPHRSVTLRRARILQASHIQVVFDIGANEGQYATELRDSGYHGRIVSFEPQAAAYQRLAARATADPRWDVRQIAVGNRSGPAELHVAANEVSSSLLAMERRHEDVAPGSAYVAVEAVQEATLDSVALELLAEKERPMLKMDVQGYEMRILEGAEQLLSRAEVVEAEVLLDALYEGQASFRQLIDTLDDAGYRAASFEPGLTDPETGRVSWMDVIWVRG